MVLLSCSGTGLGIYAKLANGMARYNYARLPLFAIHRCGDLLSSPRRVNTSSEKKKKRPGRAQAFSSKWAG
jgi:hypothetical protein